jgi:ribose 5-phosphate isomerase A
MSTAGTDRDALKRAAADAAAELVRDGMLVGLGTGSTAAFTLEALARRHRQGLRFVGIPTSEQTAARATVLGVPLTSFTRRQLIDLTIDGADEVERGTLNLIKGLGGALLHEKIVASNSRRLVIIVDEAKLVDRLGMRTPVPVEVVVFGLEATQTRLEALGADANLRVTASGEPFVTDSGNRILDCNFAHIADPARLEERIRRVVGVVESGLFIGWAGPVFAAGAAGVHRLESPNAHRGAPPVLVVMGVSGSGKSTVAKELAARLGWPFEEGDWLHPEANVAKMHAGIGLTDADRQPWLEAVAAWIDGQRAKARPGIITCSALKRSYRDLIIGDRPEVRLVYLRGSRALIAQRLAGRHGHFTPASLLQSQIDTLEEPGPDEDPLIIDIGPPASQLADEIIRLLGASEASLMAPAQLPSTQPSNGAPYDGQSPGRPTADRRSPGTDGADHRRGRADQLAER